MLHATRYLEAGASPALAELIEHDLHYFSFQKAAAFYETAVPAMRDADLALLGANDRFFLLTVLLRRKDMVHPWFYDRTREVEADSDDHLDLWARYHGKSSIITFAGTIQEIIRDPEITICIFSGTNAIAQPFLAQIKEELETNELLKRVYADVLWADPARQAAVWSRAEGIIVKRKGNPKEPIDCDEPVLTTLGWKRHGDLIVGDKVFGPDGRPTTVQAITQKWKDLPCYRVSFGNHSVVAAGTHLWEAARWRQSRARRRAGQRPEDKSSIYTTEELRVALDSNRNNPPAVRVAKPLQMPSADLPIDPYVLGVWLGDGASASARFAASKEDFPHFAAEMEKAGHQIHVYEERHNTVLYQLDRRDRSKTCRRGHDMTLVGVDTTGRCKACTSDRSAPYTVNGLAWRLRRIGLLGNKHVPNSYLMASEEQRRALLQGLMDTDGCAADDGQAIFANTNAALSEAVHFLAASLGMKPTTKRRERAYRGKPHTMWWVTFQAYADDPPFRMRRKIENCSSFLDHPRRRRRNVSAVESVDPREVSCIQVDNKDGCYLVGKSLIATHNCTVEAHGLIEALPVGRHFKLRIYDDIIDEKLVTNPDIIKKVTARWELSQNLSAGIHGRRKQHAGSRYSFADSYGILLERGILKPRIYPATHDGTLKGVPVLMSPEQWEEEKRNQRGTIAAQMLLNPLAGEESSFMIEWLRSYELRPPVLNVYIIGDPSLGRSRSSDRTAIAVIGVDPQSNRYLLDGYCHRMKLSARWQALKELVAKWRLAPGVQAVHVGWERYGLQADTEYFEEKIVEGKIEGIGEIEELNWVREGPQSKKARVDRLEPYFRNSQFWMPPKVWYDGKACTWKVPDQKDDLPGSAIVYSEWKGPSRAEKTASEAGERYRIMEPLRRLDEDGNIYDLFRVFVEEFSFFPFSPRDDLIDAMSRIEDMQPAPPMVIERGALEAPAYADS